MGNAWRRSAPYYGTTCEDDALLTVWKVKKGAAMSKVKLCTNCGSRLGLGVVSKHGKLYCGTGCRSAHHAGTLEQAGRRKAVASLFQLLYRAASRPSQRTLP